jgi:hypothetical protein
LGESKLTRKKAYVPSEPLTDLRHELRRALPWLQHHRTTGGVHWRDDEHIESLLRNPGPVLEQLQSLLEARAKGTDQIRKQGDTPEGLLEARTVERNRVVALYRHGRITDAELDAQIDAISKEDPT